MNANDSLGPPLQLEKLLGALERHGVDYVVVGGVAGLAHGSSFPTFDLDIAYARDAANLDRLAAVLRDLGVKLRGAPADLPFQVDAVTLANGANFTFETEFGDFDILAAIDGMSSYEDLRRASRVATVEGVSARVASLDDLIAMKKSANRTKDKLMIEDYLVIADEQHRLEENADA